MEVHAIHQPVVYFLQNFEKFKMLPSLRIYTGLENARKVPCSNFNKSYLTSWDPRPPDKTTPNKFLGSHYLKFNEMNKFHDF